MRLRCLFTIRFESESLGKKKEKERQEDIQMHKGHIPVQYIQIRATYAMPRYADTQLYTHYGEISLSSYLFALQTISFSRVHTQNSPLMSNSRLDDFYFVLFLFFLCLLFTTHTIIAFVPLRSLVVLNFHQRHGEKKSGRKRNIHLSIPLHDSNVAHTKKEPSQKNARALACFPACN